MNENIVINIEGMYCHKTGKELTFVTNIDELLSEEIAWLYKNVGKSSYSSNG